MCNLGTQIVPKTDMFRSHVHNFPRTYQMISRSYLPSLLQQLCKWACITWHGRMHCALGQNFPPSQERQSTLRNLNEMLAEVQDKHGDYKESALEIRSLVGIHCILSSRVVQHLSKFWVKTLDNFSVHASPQEMVTATQYHSHTPSWLTVHIHTYVSWSPSNNMYFFLFDRINSCVQLIHNIQ